MVFVQTIYSTQDNLLSCHIEKKQLLQHGPTTWPYGTISTAAVCSTTRAAASPQLPPHGLHKNSTTCYANTKCVAMQSKVVSAGKFPVSKITQHIGFVTHNQADVI